jgi:hypothetical protein
MMPIFENDISRLHWQTKVLEGSFERLPRLGADPVLWPIVEARLGRGVGFRVVRMMLSSHHAKASQPVIFKPPSWWQIEGLEQAFETFDTEAEQSLGWHYAAMKPRPDGGLRIDRGKATVATVRIEGLPLDVAAAEAYALAWGDATDWKAITRKYKGLRPIHQARLSQ